MKPVFEELAFAYQLLEVPGAVIGHARPQRVVMGAFDNGYGIDLNVPEAFDGAQHGALVAAEGFGSQQTLLVERKGQTSPMFSS